MGAVPAIASPPFATVTPAGTAPWSQTILDTGESLAFSWSVSSPPHVHIILDFYSYHGQPLAKSVSPGFALRRVMPGPDHTINSFGWDKVEMNENGNIDLIPGQPTTIHGAIWDAQGRLIAVMPGVIDRSEWGYWVTQRHGFLRFASFNYNVPDNGKGSRFVLTDAWHHDSCATSGPCWNKSYADCSDNDRCTSDLCDAAHGGCYHVPLPDGISCSDAGGHCKSGSCE